MPPYAKTARKPTGEARLAIIDLVYWRKVSQAVRRSDGDRVFGKAGEALQCGVHPSGGVLPGEDSEVRGEKTVLTGGTCCDIMRKMVSF